MWIEAERRQEKEDRRQPRRRRGEIVTSYKLRVTSGKERMFISLCVDTFMCWEEDRCWTLVFGRWTGGGSAEGG